MARPQLLQESFTRMIQDVPRDELPADAAWLISDMLPDYGSPSNGGRLMKRGAYTYASASVSATMSSAQYATAMGIHRPTSRLCFTTDNNKFGYITLGGAVPLSVTQVSTSGIQSTGNYAEHAGTLVIPNNDGTTTPKSYDGTTFGNLAGSPPAGKHAAVWKDRTILANVSANNNRVYFSGLSTPTTWDTTNSWQDVIRPIYGLAALPNALLVFGSDQTARIRGTTPPPDGDLIVDDPIFNIGTTFPRSIAVNGSLACFANVQGVYLTNGSNMPQDLTAMCGIKNYWQSITANRLGAGGGAADIHCGFFSHFLFVFVQRTTTTTSSKLVIFDLQARSCVIANASGGSGAGTSTKFANCYSLAQTPEIGDELYVGFKEDRVSAMSSIFSTGTADPDGTTITCSLETRYYLDPKTYKKRWRYAYLDYSLVDNSADNPTLAVSYVDEPLNATATSLTTLSETSTSPIYSHIRAKIPVRLAKRGLGFVITQSGKSLSTVIDALLVDVQSREGGRVN